jgi:hypothetical protein
MQYKLERKLPGETTYSVLQTVAAKGTVFSAQNYSVNDVLQVSGIIQYRIVQVIDTNTVGYRAYAIDSVSVTAGSSCAATNINDPAAVEKKIQLFPNPVAAQQLVVQFKEPNSGNYLLQVLNAQGQLLLQEYYIKPNSTVSKQMKLPSLPAGKYLLVIFKNGERYSTKEFIQQ